MNVSGASRTVTPVWKPQSAFILWSTGSNMTIRANTRTRMPAVRTASSIKDHMVASSCIEKERKTEFYLLSLLTIVQSEQRTSQMSTQGGARSHTSISPIYCHYQAAFEVGPVVKSWARAMWKLHSEASETWARRSDGEKSTPGFDTLYRPDIPEQLLVKSESLPRRETVPERG